MQMQPDVARLAKEYEVTPQEMREMLRDTYDGYRFSRNSPDIYNPFSLMKAFNQRELRNFWFESDTLSYLLRQMRRFRTDGRRIVKVGMGFSIEKRSLTDYQIVEDEPKD